jgi:hypothetical protein
VGGFGIGIKRFVQENAKILIKNNASLARAISGSRKIGKIEIHILDVIRVYSLRARIFDGCLIRLYRGMALIDLYLQ